MVRMNRRTGPDPEVWKKQIRHWIKLSVWIKVVAACNSQNSPEKMLPTARLNQWVNKAVKARWMVRWKNGTNARSLFDEEMLAGRICYGGLDLSSTTDITAFCFGISSSQMTDEHYYVLPLLPNCRKKHYPSRVDDHIPYDIWGGRKTSENH